MNGTPYWRGSASFALQENNIENFLMILLEGEVYLSRVGRGR
jgi:hypothetical protein